VLQTAVTSAPSDLAIWTANVPTPPDAPFDQDLLPILDLTRVAQTHEGGGSRQWHRRRLLERQAGGFEFDHTVRDRDVFGECPVIRAGIAVHLVASLKPGHSAANRFHPAREVAAANLPLGPLNPSPGANRARYGSPRIRCHSRAFTEDA
jgi:hypothetical protein